MTYTDIHTGKLLVKPRFVTSSVQLIHNISVFYPVCSIDGADPKAEMTVEIGRSGKGNGTVLLDLQNLQRDLHLQDEEVCMNLPRNTY